MTVKTPRFVVVKSTNRFSPGNWAIQEATTGEPLVLSYETMEEAERECEWVNALATPRDHDAKSEET